MWVTDNKINMKMEKGWLYFKDKSWLKKTSKDVNLYDKILLKV